MHHKNPPSLFAMLKSAGRFYLGNDIGKKCNCRYFYLPIPENRKDNIQKLLDMNIRQATPADYDNTLEVTRAAFWNVYCPGCSEHYLLHLMRQLTFYLPQLDLVAEQDGKIAGSCVSIASYIEGDDDKRHEVLCLGPIAVAPNYQRQGIGAALIAATADIARQSGFGAIILCGNPDYYLRHGFSPAQQWNIRTAEDKYFVALMAMELNDNALKDCGGRYIEHDIYHVNPTDVECFDRQYPPMEKLDNTPSQLHFQQLLDM